jgi:hypothetical protein
MSSSISTSERHTLTLRILGALAAGLALLLAAELVLRALPIARAIHPQDPPSAAGSMRFAANRAYTWSIGWDLRNVVHGKTNNMGFLSPREYTAEKRAIALFGDSFAEAQMLDYGESIAGRLETHFHDRLDVFNFGLSAASLPHYLGMARELGSSFRFEAAVVIVTSGDYTGGFETQPGFYRWSANPDPDLVMLVPAIRPSRVHQIVRELALVRYLRANLKFSPSQLLASSRQGPCAPAQLTAAAHQRLARYVDELPPALGMEPEKFILVFHSHIRDIYERVDQKRATPAGHCQTVDQQALAELRRLAAARGMKLLDASALLEGHYRAHRRPLGFDPVDSHWNAMATAVLARGIAALLEAPRQEKIARQ